MDIRPFDFTRLPKLSHRALEVKASLETDFPGHPFAQKIRETIQEVVRKQLTTELSFRLESVQQVSLKETLQQWSSQGVYLVFGFPPQAGKAVLDLDPFLAHMAIDKLLGGPGGAPTAIRTMTEIEDAILSFLFLKIFYTLFEHVSGALHLRMERFYTSPEAFAESVASETQGVLVNFRLGFFERVGYARLVIPQKLVDQILMPAVQGLRDQEEKKLAQQRLTMIEKFSTSLWMELGRTDVSVKEINQLEPGDVVLLENCEARIDQGMLAGYLPMRVGKGEQGAIRGEIIPDRKRLRIKIEGVQREHRV